MVAAAAGRPAKSFVGYFLLFMGAAAVYIVPNVQWTGNAMDDARTRWQKMKAKNDALISAYGEKMAKSETKNGE